MARIFDYPEFTLGDNALHDIADALNEREIEIGLREGIWMRPARLSDDRTKMTLVVRSQWAAKNYVNGNIRWLVSDALDGYDGLEFTTFYNPATGTVEITLTLK